MSSTTLSDSISGPAPADQPVPELCELSESELLAEASETISMLRELEAYQLRVAYEWAISHPAIDAADTPSGTALPGVLTEPDTLGGSGTPAVAAYTAESLSVATASSPGSACALMADAVDLVHRLPLLWDQVRAGMAPAWKARRVAARTRALSFDAAGWVDRHLAGRVSSVGPAMLDRMVAQATARCDGDALADHERRDRDAWDVVLSHPGEVAGTSRMVAIGDTVDLTRFHEVVCAEAETLAALGNTDELGVRKARALGVIADQQARLDLTDGSTGTVESLGPITLDLLQEWVGRTRVTIQPVLHVATEDRWSVDRHDPPPTMADRVRLRDDVCVFPWCSRPARACDLDHVEPYTSPDDGGPPGQTTPINLAPLCRRHHRAKTSGRWRYHSHDPGEYLWHGPSGASAFVTHQGTVALPLG